MRTTVVRARVEGWDVKLLLLVLVAAAFVAAGFYWQQPWIGAVGLLVMFVGMFTDRDDVANDDEKRSFETTKSVRNMRTRDR
ncbi:hypothetical protein [Actinomadura rupiterrae]|uniref:hypothetical protein n=1 Tax=Actinomadura rupiterrae TaxID=559627 RepID=UPI0020A5E2EF|nr:hypothetical protein [Actinomadura rupiterrae]MCP2338139.1 fatty acid desaturase [Actinomadura rupiterrae]